MIPVTVSRQHRHQATRLLADDTARPQPGQGRRVAGRRRHRSPDRRRRAAVEPQTCPGFRSGRTSAPVQRI